MKEDIKPFIIVSDAGEVVALLQTNEKGYKKSIENGQIWAVNPDTQRLLPEDGFGRTLSFREKPEWYEVSVAPEGSGAASTAKPSAGQSSVSGDGPGSGIIERLFRVIEQRRAELPEGSYTTHLFNSGLSKIKKKTGEEAVELLLAENREETIYEAADLIYHMLVFFAAADIKPEEVFRELESRE